MKDSPIRYPDLLTTRKYPGKWPQVNNHSPPVPSERKLYFLLLSFVLLTMCNHYFLPSPPFSLLCCKAPVMLPSPTPPPTCICCLPVHPTLISLPHLTFPPESPAYPPSTSLSLNFILPIISDMTTESLSIPFTSTLLASPLHQPCTPHQFLPVH